LASNTATAMGFGTVEKVDLRIHNTRSDGGYQPWARIGYLRLDCSGITTNPRNKRLEISRAYMDPSRLQERPSKTTSPVERLHAYIRPFDEERGPRALMESALLRLIRSAALLGLAQGRF
jgi:hypothetical protein